jgi:hypothetical protein
MDQNELDFNSGSYGVFGSNPQYRYITCKSNPDIRYVKDMTTGTIHKMSIHELLTEIFASNDLLEEYK